jgi:hypothetical protein
MADLAAPRAGRDQRTATSARAVVALSAMLRRASTAICVPARRGSRK